MQGFLTDISLLIVSLLQNHINKDTSKTWSQALDLDPGPRLRKTWTEKNLDPEKPGF